MRYTIIIFLLLFVGCQPKEETVVPPSVSWEPECFAEVGVSKADLERTFIGKWKVLELKKYDKVILSEPGDTFIFEAPSRYDTLTSDSLRVEGWGYFIDSLGRKDMFLWRLSANRSSLKYIYGATHLRSKYVYYMSNLHACSKNKLVFGGLNTFLTLKRVSL